MDRFMKVKCTDGRIVEIDPFDLFTGGATLLGMSINTIVALQDEYNKRGGKDPATPESVSRAFSSALPRWKCHKIVEAFKINDILAPVVPNGKTTLRSKDDLRVYVDPSYMTKHNPQIGGYFVRYEDGYESYSPAAAFENGYTLVGSILPGRNFIPTPSEVKKPPLGVMPEKLWKESRVAELVRAIDCRLPQEASANHSDVSLVLKWTRELIDHIRPRSAEEIPPLWPAGATRKGGY
jgi:hypothetical protein